MQKMQFSIEIKASQERVWNTLWENKTFRDWASIVDEGTYMVGFPKALEREKILAEEKE